MLEPMRRFAGGGDFGTGAETWVQQTRAVETL
jgi:hypothetical protein